MFIRCASCFMRHIQQLNSRLNKVSALSCYSTHVAPCTQTLVVDVALRQNSFCGRSHTCGELNLGHVGSKVMLCGWLQFNRMDGRFITLRDSHGTTQIAIGADHDEVLLDTVKNLSLESVLEVHGTVTERPEGQCNEKMSTGQIEVRATGVTVLNHCKKDLPFDVRNFHKVRESLRMEYRYLDLRNAEMQRNLRLRSRLLMKMRHFLCDMHDFIDIETPTLFRRTPGGAKEFVVPTHSPGMYYTLPQSPQQFKQLLMVGGIDRYMQIARCYRDESAKPDRQPEFTQLDIEMSFASEEDILQLTESLLVYAWPEDVRSHPLTTPFPRLTYDQVMRAYGSDKPDTRFEMMITDVTSLVSGSSLQPVLDAVHGHPNTSIQALNFTQAGKALSNKALDKLKQSAKDLGETTRGCTWSSIVRVKEDGDWQGSLAGLLGGATHAAITRELRLKPGDLLVVTAGETNNALTLLGRLRLLVASAVESTGAFVRDHDAMNFLWVTDFPLFLPKEDGQPGLESAHHPFTAPRPADAELIYTKPDHVQGQHYDLVLNGNEIGGGSIRIHDSALQRYVLTDILKENPGPLEHLLTALQCGAPPHGGIAIGLDRLLAILCRASSIRDVIAFPKSSEGKDLMAKAPAELTQADVQYYHLKA